MKTFTSLILEKVRLILLLKNAPNLAKTLKEQVSEDDWKQLEVLATEKLEGKVGINSAVLLELLKAYDATGRAYIESLPLEMAVIDVVK
jgi:hypothetical protein